MISSSFQLLSATHWQSYHPAWVHKQEPEEAQTLLLLQINTLPPSLCAPHPHDVLCPLPSPVFLCSLPPCQSKRLTSAMMQRCSAASACGEWGELVSKIRITGRAVDFLQCNLCHCCNQAAVTVAGAACRGSSCRAKWWYLVSWHFNLWYPMWFCGVILSLLSYEMYYDIIPCYHMLLCVCFNWIWYHIIIYDIIHDMVYDIILNIIWYCAYWYCLWYHSLCIEGSVYDIIHDIILHIIWYCAHWYCLWYHSFCIWYHGHYELICMILPQYDIMVKTMI